MSNPNKAKGTRWEGDARDVFQSKGVNAYRPAQAGFADTSDLHGVPYFAVQCKDWRDVTGAIREGLDGAQKQKANLGVPFGVAVVKRARKPADEGYAVLRLVDFARIARLVEHLADVLGDDGFDALLDDIG